MSNDDSVFDTIPKFDAATFAPPAWASGPAFDFTRKNGESSRSGLRAHDSDAHSGDPSFGPNGSESRGSREERHGINGVNDGDLSDDDEEEEVWEDARDSLEDTVEVTDEGLSFTLPEMKASLLSHAVTQPYQSILR